MPNIQKKTKMRLWALILAVSIIVVVADAIFLRETWWAWLIVLVLVMIGCVFSFSGYFFVPKKHCPRCNTEVPSQYTQNCPKCGLKLVTRCMDCGKYISVYQYGKPSKYCNQCGLELDLKEVQIEVIENPYVSDKKIRFCPNCGVNIEEDNLRFCALCGTKIY